MSETETDPNQGADAASAETTPDATQGADGDQPAVVTPAEPTPPENAVSGGCSTCGGVYSCGDSCSADGSNLDYVMLQRGNADATARATGTEAAVCADIAERQRKGVRKYGVTVADNPLSVAQWLTHAYEEVLDLAIYLKRTIHEIETTNDIPSSRRMAGALTGKLRRPRAPGSRRKPKPCPNCGAEKSIGMTTLNKIPTRRCKACGHVVKQYPNLAKATA